MWRACAHAKAVPGVRIAYTDEREIQHALDAGALVLVVPTVDTEAEARQVVEWTYFPPMGRRSNGGGQAFDAAMWGGVPGGYRATAKGPGAMELALGFSHPVNITAPDGVTFEVPAPNRIVVSGIDKEAVGQVAADIRAWRKPEPYKGKGVRYAGEHVRRKAGKAGK